MTFRRLLLLILGWLAFVYAVPFVVLQLFAPAEVRALRLDAFYERADEIEAITLGSSHGRSIFFPAMDLTGHALSEDNGDVATAEMKLRAAVTRLPELDYVFMPVSPALLTYDHRISDGENWLLYRTWLRNTPLPDGLGALGAGEMLHLYSGRVFSVSSFVRVNELAKGSVTSLVRGALGGVDDAIDARACHVIENPPDFPHENGILNGYYRTPLPTVCLPQAARANAENHLYRARENLRDGPGARALNLALLARMAETARDAGARLVLFVPPFTRTYYETPDLMALWTEERPEIVALARETVAQFYDFHDFFWDRGYRHDNRVFTDGNHLTLEGAAQFSEALAARLAEEGDDSVALGAEAATRTR